MKAPVEVTLTKATPPRRGWGWWRNDDYVDDGEVGVLRIGRNLAVLDTTFSETDDVTKRWLAEASVESRGRRLRAPLVVGLVALRGHDPATRDRYWCGGDFKPNDPANPIRAIALCLGGSRVLVYCPDTGGCRVRKPDRNAGGRLKFWDNSMNQLRAFLDDKRITVACFGAREAAKKLAKEWGLHVAWPAEVTDLFVRAYGKAAGLDEGKAKRTLPAKYWMGKAALARERAKAERDGYDTDDTENDGPDPWNRAEKMVRGLSLERMARVAIGPEMRLARWPAKVADADWGGHCDVGEEEWAYATRDAFLCFEIASRCLQKLGVPTGPRSRRVPPP